MTTEVCTHPLLITDDDSLRYFYCPKCDRTLRLIVIIGPLGAEDPKYILIGRADIS